MSKEELIKQAWGEYYEKIKNRLDKNGWYNYFSLTHKVMKEKYHQFDNLDLEEHTELYLLRPKSLQGIENNNGWIKIESEDDLPKEEIDVHFIFTEYEGKKGRFQTYGVWDNNLKSFYSGALKINNVTHYQPIEKPKPPIY